MGYRFLAIAAVLFATPLASGQFFSIALSDAVGFTGDSVDVALSLDHEGAGLMQGWSWGVCHDPEDLELTGLALGTALELFPPDFFSVLESHPGGWTAAVVYEIGGQGIPPGLDYEMYIATYEIVGTESAVETTIEFCETLDSPPVLVVVVVGGLGITPEQESATVTINPTSTLRRGDGNDDSQFDIADAVYVLEYLFYDGPPLLCPDAGDANDDGALDIADPVYILEALFGGGPGIPAPGWAECGVDPTDDTMGCASHQCP